MSQASRLSQEERATFAGLADLLIPRHGRMPAATEVGAHAELLDQVLGHRPDIVDDLLRGLAAAEGRGAERGGQPAQPERCSGLQRDHTRSLCGLLHLR